MSPLPQDKDLLYHKVEPVEGSLPAQDLVARALRYTAKITDYDVLAASIALNHQPSFQQALRIGKGFFSGSFKEMGDNLGCVLYSVPRLYFNESKASNNPSGSEQEGIQYIKVLLPLVQYAPRPVLHEVLDGMLISAIQKGSWEMAKFLHSQGASFDLRSAPDKKWQTVVCVSALHAVSSAPDHGKEQFLKWLPSVMDTAKFIDKGNIENSTPLLCAVKNGDIITMTWLLENGADPLFRTNDESGLIHHAMTVKNAEEVLGSLKQILDPLLFTRLINDNNDNGYYPIHELVGMMRNSFPVHLITPSSGIDTPIAASQYTDCYQGFSPLGLAFVLGDFPLAVSLVRAGASVDKLTPDGHTPWHLIADLSTSGNEEDQRSVRGLVRLANKLGVSPEKVVNGKSAYAVASSAYFKEVLAQLRAKNLGGLVYSSPNPPAFTSAKPKM